MTKLWLDYETRSVVDLEERGLDVYAHDPSTEIILASYAFNDGKPKLWQPHLAPLPTDLREALTDCFTEVWSWNAQFERIITRQILKIDKPIEEWRDPSDFARYLSLPGSLEEAGEILGLGLQAKIKDGKRLIKLFCEPESLGGETTLFGISKPTFRDWRTHPQDWQAFCEYNMQDVIAEREAWKRMRKFAPPESEHEIWCLSEKINERGWPVDEVLVANAARLTELEMKPLLLRMKEICGLENPNSRDQVLGWLQTHGYPFSSLAKEFVARALAGEGSLTPEARELIELRNQTAKTSVQKYTAIRDMMGEGARLRYQYTYYGAHTGRWAAHGVNVGNLPRPTKEVEKKLDFAIQLVRGMDYEGLKREFGKPLDVVASVLRSAFRAPEGKKFVVADLRAIENVMLGFLARCGSILDVFRQDLDPYLAFATRMYHQPYATLLAEYKAGDSTKRTNSKPAVLGAGYALQAGREYMDSDGNKQWTGLMAYSRKMGIELSQEDAELSIRTFRGVHKEVPWLWKDLERAAISAIRHSGSVIGAGIPHSQRDREYFEEKGRPIYDKALISFLCHSDKWLEMILPSGRSLFYDRPSVVKETRTWEKRDYQKDVIYYYGKDQKTRQWVPQELTGGKATENADQAISRDILVHGMKLADARGFEVIGHTYDELACLADVDGDLGIDELRACMATASAWCGTGLPLAAEGFESEVYRKN